MRTNFITTSINILNKTLYAFSSEQALMKLMYLITKNNSKKWTMLIHNWEIVFSQLYIKFSYRILQENRGF